jgi:hypothetical protein
MPNGYYTKCLTKKRGGLTGGWLAIKPAWSQAEGFTLSLKSLDDRNFFGLRAFHATGNLKFYLLAFVKRSVTAGI